MFDIYKTTMQGKERESVKVTSFNDVTCCINHVLSLMQEIASDDMDGKKYAFYIVEPITWTVIRKFMIEG